MKIDLTPYLQRALEHVVSQPVDLSAVHVELHARMARCAGRLDLATTLTADPDAGWQFREALRQAGMDDLRVFELGRAFDQAFGGAR